MAPLAPMSLYPRLRVRGRMGNGVRELSVSMGADTQESTRGRGALEISDLRLLEDSSERGGALVPNLVANETARDR